MNPGCLVSWFWTQSSRQEWGSSSISIFKEFGWSRSETNIVIIHVSGKCWHLFGAPITQQEPAAVLSGQARTVRDIGPDGPRPGARLEFPAWRPDGPRLGTDGPRPRAGQSARAQGRRKIVGGAWISLPGGTPLGRRDPRSCLGLAGRPRLL
jgi:hypothetical protein